MERRLRCFCGDAGVRGAERWRRVLAAGHEVALVVTQPDRAAGRGMEVQLGAVKAAALRHGLPVIAAGGDQAQRRVSGAAGALAPDAILVVAYGRIVPDWMLALPRFGCINLHGSLLPKYRGAAPIQWAVANGETRDGCDDDAARSGPRHRADAAGAGGADRAGGDGADLFESLAEIGAELMVKTLAGWSTGRVRAVEQDHAQATLAPILTREDGRMDFARTAQRSV